MDPEGEKRDSLSDRIRKAEAGAKGGAEPESKSPPVSAGARIGFDFAGSVVGSGIVGAIMDHAFKTSPWCLLGMVVVGFAIGIVSAWRAMQKSEEDK